MKIMSVAFLTLAVFGLGLQISPGQTTSTTTTTTVSGPVSSSAQQALGLAQNAVDASIRSRLVSVYGTGTPSAISQWYFIFFDPSVPSHGRAVLVQNGAVVRTYEAKGGVVYDNSLTFDASQVTGEEAALGAAQNYAAEHTLAYNHVRALLRITTAQPTLRWRIELLHGTYNRGFVFVNANDGSFAMYAPAHSHSTSSASVEGEAEQAGNDRQQFFTGERTVDQ
jgi:hypothetical protein